MDFSFLVSKLGQLLLSPSNLLLLLLLTAVLLAPFRRTAQLAMRIRFLASLALVTASLLPIGDLLLGPLERRFPPLGRCIVQATDPIAGIILLGGSLGSVTIWGSVQDVLSGSADRIRLAAALSRAYPEAPLLVSGGRAFPRQGGRSEAAATADYLRELGVSPDRIVLETASRTTAENAAFVARRTGRSHGARWLLVTSAFHMPRAVGTFRAAGLQVTAAPTDWQVDEHSDGLTFSVTDRLRALDIAAKEYLGLLTYWATGRSNALFPGPGTSACAGNANDIRIREIQ